MRLFQQIIVVFIAGCLSSLSRADTTGYGLTFTSYKSKTRESEISRIQPLYYRHQVISGSFIFNYLGSGFGLELASQLNKYTTIASSINYTQASLEGNDFREYSEIYESNTRRLGVHLRYFPISQIYFGMGMNFNYTIGDYSLQTTSMEYENLDIPFTYRFIHADLNIGTQWPLEKKFILSVDLLGRARAVANTLTETTNPDQQQTVRTFYNEDSSGRIIKLVNQQLFTQSITIRVGIKI